MFQILVLKPKFTLQLHLNVADLPQSTTCCFGSTSTDKGAAIVIVQVIRIRHREQIKTDVFQKVVFVFTFSGSLCKLVCWVGPAWSGLVGWVGPARSGLKMTRPRHRIREQNNTARHYSMVARTRGKAGGAEGRPSVNTLGVEFIQCFQREDVKNPTFCGNVCKPRTPPSPRPGDLLFH